MPASADYLTKYLTASNRNNANANGDFDESARPKKRRKKDKSTANSTVLIDDDEDLLLSSLKARQAGEDGEDGPLIYQTKVRSAEFRRNKASNWQSVQDSGTDALQRTNNGDDADRILADAAAESDRRRRDVEVEDAPAIVTTTQDDEGPRMSSGARAGLQTAADTAVLLAREEAEREDESTSQRRKKKTRGEPLPEQETIYRDATGRRIDVSLRRAEARAAELEKAAAERREREQAMGDVQRRDKEQAKQDLEDAKFLTLGRSADDEDLNERQKAELRWEDPMAAYIAEQRAEEGEEHSSKDNRDRRGGDVPVEKLRKKEYQGAAAPNRYAIKPGWRWDGVDRGNGFEKQWFQARSNKSRNENLEYQWAMDE